ncbi:hypothetical protein [Mycoplasmoides fastidiosum]|uniref:hypothetical protein n=1 Tax=Mycoplasmoides fastidiosum TaxID=92758 RepID=UPI00211543A1|nr:hypothetical protein [Mycoplasmoides fastidiosum]UUD37832.1 hypothetical protein NPA10_00330 [Mycoplasmoides fastidiosum]
MNLKNKLEEFSVDDTKHFVGSFLEYDKDENNFLEIFQKIYLMNSIQEQNLDFSLWLINEKTKNKNWSEWAMIAFNYCQAQNIKLNSLIKKLKVIYNLSIDHNKFLASYGYDDFWKNLKQHEKFLVDYDESVMEKGLFYLKKYIELKKLPDKVRFYTLSEDDRINYTTLYKFFYNAANTKLFYVSWADLKILLNAKLVNREEFLAITNENWIRNQPVFNTFINSDLFQKRLIDNFSDEKYQHNLDILVHNYFLNLWKRITDFSPNQKNELQKMFNYATNKNGKIPPSLFIDKFWKIILELFPFIIWDLHNNLYFNEKVFYNKFNTAYWFISHKNAKLIPQIFSHWENTHVFYYYAEENLGYSLNAQIKNLNIKEFNINYNLNTNNYRIAKTINNLFLAVDKNDHKIDRKIKTILVNENYFFKDINLSLFKKLIDDFNNLFLEKNDQSVNVIVVKNQFHKNYLLKIFLSYPTIMTAIAENKLIVLNLDEEINFPVERIFFVLNDRISFTKNLSLNSFYNDPKMRTDLIKFLFWAKNSVIVYAPFSKEQIDLKNKKNQLLLRNLFTENLEKKERSQDNLIYQVHKKIKDWLFNLLEDKYQIQITFNEATGQFYTSVSDRKNRAILFIKLIHNESISLDHNLELSFFMKQKNYSVYNLFIYEWIFKEEMVKKELTTFLIKEKIID